MYSNFLNNFPKKIIAKCLFNFVSIIYKCKFTYLILRKYKKTLSLSLSIYIYIYNSHFEQLTAATCMEGRNKLTYDS